MLLILISCFFSSAARTWVVDNNVKSIGDTSSLTAAISMASSGDTIIVQPSYQDYGNITLTKKLVVYSNGGVINQGGIDFFASLTSLTINSSAVSSVISGFRIIGSVSCAAKKTKILSNYILDGISITADSVHVLGNIFLNNSYYTTYLFYTANSKRIIVSNNFIQRKIITGVSYGSTASVFINFDSTCVISNNFIVEIIDGGSIVSGGFKFFNNVGAKITNNILWSNISTKTNFASGYNNANFNRNITYAQNSVADTLPNGYNFNDTMPSFSYLVLNKNPRYDRNNNMQLISSSLGKGIGTDGKDIGLFGGNYKYNHLAIPTWIGSDNNSTIKSTTIKKGQPINLKIKINSR